jgi:ABC-type transport system involved in multi-copper enzyme maturation permease subunit
MNLAQRLWKNPVIVKEIRTRMRGSRAFWMVSIHLIILALILGVVYMGLISATSSPGNLEQRRYLGKAIFGLLIALELITISFTAPALTAGMISSEHERKTYDLLRVTLLPASSLVAGKYISGLVFVFLLVFTSLPLMGPAFMIGGISIPEILIAALILLVTAIAFCAMGIFFSSLFRRTLISTVITYGLSILLIFGIPFISLIILLLFGASLDGSSRSLTPSIAGVLVAMGWLLVSLTPLGSMLATEIAFLDQQSWWTFSISLPENVKMTLISPWVIYVIFYLVLSGLLLWVSMRLIQRKEI